MTGYLVAGLVLGSIYALAASGITLTYASTGILNFAFGAIGYFVALFYYFLNSDHGWPIAYAALLALASGPLLGVILFWTLFRFIRLASSVVKVVATIGLSVALPALAITLFGNQTIFLAPGLAPDPVGSFRISGVPITYDQLYVFGALIFIVAVGAVVMRFTDAGLCVRAIVDSEAMTSLSGTNPTRVYMAVWAVSTFVAGLVGILAAPSIGLVPNSFTLLTAAAFAAVVVARLRSIPISVIAALAMGVVSSLIQYAMPPSSALTSGFVDSVPFLFIAIAIVFFMRKGRLDESEGVGGALDRAIVTQATPPSGATRPSESEIGAGPKSGNLAQVGNLLKGHVAMVQGLIVVGILALLPLILAGQWEALLGEAFSFAIVFLAMTLTTGEGGMVWLCQITFAGIGAIAAAQLSTRYGWPVIPSVFLGGLIAVPFGLVVGYFTIRLGDLYVALTTLTFGLLMDNLVFSSSSFTQLGSGVALNRPSFASGDGPFAYLCLIVFCVIALFVVRLRHSTIGLALNAVRSSETGARTIGLNVVSLKLMCSGFGALIAGIGGGFLAMYATTALPASYATFEGLVWLAVLVTFGIRSNIAAVFAGLSLAFIPAIFQAYLPVSLGNVPSILFGLGAIGLAVSPDGLLTHYAHVLGRAFGRVSMHLFNGSLQPAKAGTVATNGGDPFSVSDVGDLVSSSSGQDKEKTPVDLQLSLSLLGAASTSKSESEELAMSAVGVTVQFGGLRALQQVSLAVKRGEITGLVGPNGAGKSTLFAVMSGLLRPQAGSILLDGEDVTRLSPQGRARLGLARTFQQTELYAGLTVRDHLVLAHRARFAPGRLWTDLITRNRIDVSETKRIDALLGMLGLTNSADQRAAGLPLGVGRRLEVARALATGPKVVLLDEPSSGLDERESRGLSLLLRRVVEELGVSMVLVEHDVAMVLDLCCQICVLDFGQVIANGDPSEIRKNEAVQRAYLGDELGMTAEAVSQ